MGDLLFSKEDSFHPFFDSWGRKTTADVREGFAPGFANQRFARKLSVCSAKVVDFVSDPPQLRPLFEQPAPVPLFVNSVDLRVGR
jgi:hypothetical protein